MGVNAKLMLFKLDSMWVQLLDRLDRFDSIAGTDTAGSVRSHGFNYYPMRIGILREVFGSLSIGPLDSLTFVDIGCGKGRPLLVASLFGFKRLVGVELSEDLAAIARRNLAVFSPPDRITKESEIQVEDARSFTVPDGDLLVYAYQPFDAESLARMLDHLTASVHARPRRCFFLYLYGRMHDVFATRPSFRAVASRPAGGRMSKMGWTLFELVP